MKKIKLWIETGFTIASHETIVEVEDDITEDELEEMAMDYMNEQIIYGWSEE